MNRNDGASLDAPPADWSKKTIGQLGTVVGGGTPSRGVSGKWGGGIPWVTPGELTGLRSKYLDGTEECITRSGLAGSGATLLPENSLLVTTRATIGNAALAAVPTATNQGFKSVIFGAESSPDFYYHLIPHIRGELVRRASGTTFLEISGREFASVVVPAPRLWEQRRIATILDTLDETIRCTQIIIAKLGHIRQGLLHDLLTRGVDEGGELRPPPDEMPHLYEDTPLGLLPRAWRAAKLGSMLTGIDAGSSPHLADTPAQPGEWGVLKVSAVKPEGFVARQNKAIHDARLMDSRYEVRVGDLLMTRANTAELVGIACLVEAAPPRLLLCDKVLRLRLDGTSRAAFVAHVLAMDRVRRQIEVNATGSSATMKNISQAAIRELIVPIPPLPEQAAIMDALAGNRARLSEEGHALRKLQSLKLGLSGDLLTCLVRVLEEASA